MPMIFSALGRPSTLPSELAPPPSVEARLIVLTNVDVPDLRDLLSPTCCRPTRVRLGRERIVPLSQRLEPLVEEPHHTHRRASVRIVPRRRKVADARQAEHEQMQVVRSDGKRPREEELVEDARLEQDLLAKVDAVLRRRREHAKVGVAKGNRNASAPAHGLHSRAACRS